MQLTPELIHGFSESILSAMYDEPKPTPSFHMEMWAMCCSDNPQVAIAAPRNHAKSTSITHAYLLAAALFRAHRYILIISDTEEQAAEFLSDIKEELKNNDVLRVHFGVKKILKDAETNLIVQMEDGYKFRIIAKGSEQKIRGRKWLGMRLSLIIGDDLENDEIVMNPDRRKKFRDWFFRGAKQALRDKGQIRVVGTILHEDSLLNRLMVHSTWSTVLYKAHKSFDDFSEILWPGKHTEETLRFKRQEFIDEDDAEGYSQEFLNDPFDHSSTFFNKDDLLDIDEAYRNAHMVMYGSADLAISKRSGAAFTAIGAAGVDPRRKLQIKDVRRGRWDANEIVDEIFSVVTRWEIEEFFIEAENISKTLGPVIYEEMRRRNIYFTLTSITPSKDKEKRASPFQKMCRAGSVEFDREKDWFPVLEHELLRFPKSTYKDQTDMLAMFGANINIMIEGPTQKEHEDELYDEEFEEDLLELGASEVTGY